MTYLIQILRVAFMESPRVLVGVALRTLGLGSNTWRADHVAVGASVEDLCSKIISSANKSLLWYSSCTVRFADRPILVGTRVNKATMCRTVTYYCQYTSIEVNAAHLHSTFYGKSKFHEEGLMVNKPYTVRSKRGIWLKILLPMI
jgi:hypothetical protein